MTRYFFRVLMFVFFVEANFCFLQWILLELPIKNCIRREVDLNCARVRWSWKHAEKVCQVSRFCGIFEHPTMQTLVFLNLIVHARDQQSHLPIIPTNIIPSKYHKRYISNLYKPLQKHALPLVPTAITRCQLLSKNWIYIPKYANEWRKLQMSPRWQISRSPPSTYEIRRERQDDTGAKLHYILSVPG